MARSKKCRRCSGKAGYELFTPLDRASRCSSYELPTSLSRLTTAVIRWAAAGISSGRLSLASVNLTADL